MEPWLLLGTNQEGLVQDQFVSINVGLCGILLLREALKGEVVTVGAALVGISNSFSFSGVNNGDIE